MAKPIHAFTSPDQERLKKWMELVIQDPLPALTRRLRTTKEPAILFVGNSYSFQLPAAFKKLAAAEGRSVHVEQVTTGGWSLAQHAKNPETLAKIRNGKWDAVVIQEQSLLPSLSAHQRNAKMVPAATKLAALIRKNGAVPVLYQTWARRDGDAQHARTVPNDTFAAMHRRLAEGFAALRRSDPKLVGVRVGDAWAKLTERGKGPPLYMPDGSHPSAAGTQLTAAVFYTTLFDAKMTHRLRGVKNAADVQQVAEHVGRWSPPDLPEG